MTTNLIKAVCAVIVAILVFTAASLGRQDASRELSKHVVPFKLLIRGNSNFATGFHVKYKGKVYIVTNKHVCDFHNQNYQHNFIQFEEYVGEIIKISDVHDLCLVTSNRTDGLELSQSPVNNLDKVTLIGFPRGMNKVIREGRVISYEEITASWLGFGTRVKTIYISTTTYGGNSGSPVLNSHGKVVGVLFAGDANYNTEGQAVPLEFLKAFLALYAR